MSMTTGEHDAYMRGIREGARLGREATYAKVMNAIALGYDQNHEGNGISVAHQRIRTEQLRDKLGDNR